MQKYFEMIERREPGARKLRLGRIPGPRTHGGPRGGPLFAVWEDPKPAWEELA